MVFKLGSTIKFKLGEAIYKKLIRYSDFVLEWGLNVSVLHVYVCEREMGSVSAIPTFDIRRH